VSDFNSIASFLAGVLTGSYVLVRLLRLALHFAVVRHEVRRINQELNEYAGIGFGRWPRMSRLSLVRGLLRLAERRLPRQMDEAERERWSREMRADVASLPRHRRLRVAFNIWLKGAPKMPVGAGVAARSAGD
jgi:hypothetical protein